MKKTLPAVALLIAAASLLAGPGAAGAAEPRHRFARVPAGEWERLDQLRLSPVREAAYPAFRWLELTAADHAALERSGIAFGADPDAAFVHAAGFRFDPLVDGEPWVPADLRWNGSGAGLRLVQLAGPATDARRARLESTGLRVLQYYPHNAYLVWADAAAAAAAGGLDFVRWQGPLHPGYKIGPELFGRAGLIANVDVTVYDDGRFPETLAALAALGAQVLQHHPSQPDGAFRDVIVRLPAEAVEGVARLAAVWALGYQSPRPILDDEMSSQIVAGNYGGTPPVPVVGYSGWLTSIGQNGSGVRWAVVDTGVDYQHPDLGPHIAGGYDFPGACSFPGQPGSDCSGGGHGTHVAGIVGGDASGVFADPQGFKYGLGIAPAYEIFAMNSLSGSAWPPLGGWQEHSKRAVLGGALGGNCSWTTSEGTNHGYRASERTHDIMVRDGNFDTTTVAEPITWVFSAGNSGPSPNTLTSPKEAKNVIVVANSLNSRAGLIDAISSSSSRGPAADGRKHPHVAAPGTTIASSRNDLGGSCSTAIAGTNGLYAFCSGTSMAAPHVSGAAVLITDWWRDSHAGANPSPAFHKAMLVNTAVDMTANGAGTIWNAEEGWGRVNLSSVFGTSVRRLLRDQGDVLGGAGEVRTYQAAVATPGQPLRITLAWSDAPGAVNANPALVNDLDLTVTVGASTYRGNVFTAGWSVPGGSADRLNNLENVYVQSPGANSVTITVSAFNVPGDGVPYNADLTDQDFALVCSNCSSLRPFRLAIDDTAAGSGVLEDGETAVLRTTWRNESSAAIGPITGSLTTSSPITITTPNASYGTIAAGGEATAGYGVIASGPRPAAHWDAVVNEALSTGEGHTWRVHIGPTFSDVPASSSAVYSSIETIVHKGVTGGCTATEYCPNAPVTREQMAVFVLLAKEGPGYAPAACAPPNLFSDVPETSPFCRFVEELANRLVVAGCAPNLYCPQAPVTREQMAVFLLRTLEPALDPPACVAGSEMFADVPASSPFCRWVEELARRGITAGCGGGNYCPTAPNTRAQMAVFLKAGFALKLYEP